MPAQRRVSPAWKGYPIGVGERRLERGMDYICSRCGHRLAADEYASCPECGHPGRRMAGTTVVQIGGYTPEKVRQPPPPLVAAQPPPHVAPVAKWPYLVCFIGGCVLAVPSAVLALDDRLLGTASALALLLLAFVCVGGAVASCLVLLYRAWSAIQDGEARMTPRKVVLRCLIPVYNLFWVYQAVLGFAHDFNAFAERHYIQGTRANVELYQFWCLFAVCASVPCGGLPAGAVLLVLTPIIMTSMCNAINAVADAQTPGGSPR